MNYICIRIFGLFAMQGMCQNIISNPASLFWFGKLKHLSQSGNFKEGHHCVSTTKHFENDNVNRNWFEKSRTYGISIGVMIP